MKLGLTLLVCCIIAFMVYSFANKAADSNLEANAGGINAMVQSASIYPTQVYINNSLTLKMVNASEDDYKHLDVRWFRNDSEINGESGTSLPARELRRGSKIYAKVNLLGPDRMDKPVVTNAVDVLNTPPVVDAVEVTLRTDPSDALVAQVRAVDPDGDALKESYRWYRNGNLIGGADGRVLKLDGSAKNDKITCEAMVFDGTDESDWKQSRPWEMESNAPTITSTPPKGLTSDGRFVYAVKVEGPDPSSLRYELLKAPEGMTISNNGVIDWKLPGGTKGMHDEYDISIRVSDGSGGEAFQDFKFTIDIPKDSRWD